MKYTHNYCLNCNKLFKICGRGNKRTGSATSDVCSSECRAQYCRFGAGIPENEAEIEKSFNRFRSAYLEGISMPALEERFGRGNVSDWAKRISREDRKVSADNRTQPSRQHYSISCAPAVEELGQSFRPMRFNMGRFLAQLAAKRRWYKSLPPSYWSEIGGANVA